jgi:hypothetical protein
LVVEVLPALLHTSLFLFLSGLLIFLFNTNHTVFRAVLGWVGISAGVYGFITVLPIFLLDCPYYAPFSSSVWALYHFLILIPYISGCCRFSRQFGRWADANRQRLTKGAVKSTQEAASKLSKGIDRRILRWVFDALDEDGELLQFFEAIPGFCSSKIVDEPKEILNHLDLWGLTEAFDGFLKRTCSSSLLSITVKERRLMVCMQAIDALGRPFPSRDFLHDIFTDGHEMLRSVQVAHLLRSRCHSSDGATALSAQLMVAGVIATVPERDHRWKALVTDQLGIQEGDFQYYPGDSVLLANFIDITHELFRFYDTIWWVRTEMRSIRGPISNFDIQNALPVLQYDFCALRNEMISKANRTQDRDRFIPILQLMRDVYVRLHAAADITRAHFHSHHLEPDVLWLPCNMSQNHNLHGAATIPNRMKRYRSPSRSPSHHPAVHSATQRHRSRPRALILPTGIDVLSLPSVDDSMAEYILQNRDRSPNDRIIPPPQSFTH